MIKNADTPAMPIILDYDTNEHNRTVVNDCYNGLTKREMFAMNIMAHLSGMSLDDSGRLLRITDMDDIGKMNAKMAVEYSDALLKELDK